MMPARWISLAAITLAVIGMMLVIGSFLMRGLFMGGVVLLVGSGAAFVLAGAAALLPGRTESAADPDAP